MRREPWAFLTLTLCLSLGACDRSASSSAGSTLEDSGPLPKLTKVPAFSLTSEEGNSYGSAELNGQPYLAAFMFTRCPSICPRLTARMKEVDEAVKKADKKLRLVSISVDPDNDSPEILKAYAKKHGADVPNWTFLTGDYKTIAKTSEEGFKVGLSGEIDEGKPHLGITHGSHMVLVDRDGTIRGYFRSSEDATVNDLVAALDRL